MSNSGWWWQAHYCTAGQRNYKTGFHTWVLCELLRDSDISAWCVCSAEFSLSKTTEH